MRFVRTLTSLFGLVLLTVMFLGRATGATPQASLADAAARCTELAKVDFSQIPDAVTQITDTNLGNPIGQAPGYCEVSGYVAPSIRFRFRLPSGGWNGKFIELGCGGTCGTTEHISGCDDPLRRGYACIVSDGGNRSSGADMKWAYNNPQAVLEYLVRASHVTGIVGKAIAERFYGKPPGISYFIGCSAGGLQAMTEAQRFPWDFDGIVAGDPNVSVSEDFMNMVWANRALISDSGDAVLSHKDLEILHKAVVAKCDLNDGVKDGVIGDPRLCKFDPQELSCATHKGEGCFSATQIETVRKIYGGAVTKMGSSISPQHVFMGSELSWADLFGGSDRAPTPAYSYMPEMFRYYLFQPNPGPSWTTKNFDFDRDRQRFGMAELSDPGNPDLRRFKGRNGKLLLYTGWNDAVAGVGRTIDYYESAEKLMGGRAATQDFFRLFVIPGMNHCTGGDGAFAIDFLSDMEAWVEKGRAPDELVGSHVKLDDLMGKVMNGDKDAWHPIEKRLEFPLDPATVEFTRPIYPYPAHAKYLGHGDPKVAASFGPIGP